MDIEYSLGVWQLIGAAIVFLLGWGISLIVASHLLIGVLRSTAIYIWHTVFCFVYLWYVANFGGDAVGYFLKAQALDFEFKLGTEVIYSIVAVLVHVFGLSIHGAFLFFNIFGVIGLMLFDASLSLATKYKDLRYKVLATFIVFLPSVSFWSSAVGKDAFSFMAVCMALWAAISLRDRIFLMIIAIVIMFIVRPHIGGIMIVALAATLFINRGYSIFVRIWLGLVASIFVAIVMPFALNYAGVGGGASLKDVSEYMEERQSQNMEGGAGDVDISEMNLVLKIYTYLFRPMLYEVNSVFSLAAAIDNLLLLVLFFVGLSSFGRNNVFRIGSRFFMWSYSIITCYVLAMTTANLGIALRQKWMFVPVLIFLLISVAGKDNPKSNNV